MTTIMLYFTTKEKNDIVCELYSLANGDTDLQTCVQDMIDAKNNGDYDKTFDSYREKAGWRYPAYLAQMWVPLFVIFIEICTNRMRINFYNIVYQFVVFIVYCLITFCGQNLLSIPVYYSTLNYYCAGNTGI